MSDKGPEMTYNWWDCSELIEKIAEDGELVAKARDICTDLSQEVYSITELVEKLGPLLTSQNTSHRSRTLELFSEILKSLPRDFLKEAQLKFIVTFYADRSKDPHSVVPAILTGTLAMAQMTNIPHEEFVSLLLVLLGGSVMCQSQTRSDRETFYEIIEHSSLTYVTKLGAVKDEFLQGVLAALEGERDPRNLQRIFTFMPKLMGMYPLDHWTEEMFEVFACYFPVDFHPPPNVEKPITRDELAELLLTCLTATQGFVDFCIPLAVEKLESQIKVSKIDSLHLLSACASKYGADVFEEAFPNIWLSLKAEVLPGGNEEVTQKALETIQSILTAAKGSATQTENILNVILHSITISLCDTNLRLFAPACRIVVACCRSNAHAALCVANKLLPMCLTQIEEGTMEAQKIILLKFIKEIVGICSEKDILKDVDEATTKRMQETFVECFKCTAESKEIAEKIEIAFESMGQMIKLLDVTERECVYGNLLKILQSGAVVNVDECLKVFAFHQREEFTENVVRKLLQRDFLNATNAKGIFHCTVCLISVWKTSDILYNFLLDGVFEHPQNDIKLLALRSMESVVSEEFIKSGIIEKCIDFLRNNTDLPIDVLVATSDVLKLCMQTLREGEQSDTVAKFLPDLAPHRGNELFLFDGLIGQLCQQVDISSYFHHITKDLIEYAVEISRGEVSSSVHLDVCDKLLCYLFNRTIQDSIFEETLSQSINYLNRQIEVNFLGVRTFAWILKGLLVKGHRKATSLIKDLTTLLTSERLQCEAVGAFQILAKPTHHLPNMRPFHLQKLFELVLKYTTTDDKYTPAQLAAIAEILLHLPMKVITMNLQRIGKILFQCLDCDNTDTLLITITLINRLLQEDSDFCRYHLQSLIPRCIQLSAVKKSLKTRLAALEFLHSVTKKYDTVLLVPFRQDVVYGLQPALDDHKRNVRAAAVIARSAWFVFDSGKAE
uniref:MMS19 nucleotide excision repair protein n=2 Tax=Nyssomyia neivai TaxID=330878 RepID=A0A1L8DFY2_9DIPT